MISLTGKVAWVTGAGSGIGEAAALALAEAGATIVLTGRRLGPLEDVARRINQTGGAHVQPADLTKADEVRRVGDFVRTTLGRLDILVNNAGVNIVERHWDKLTPERIDTLLQGNLTGALYCVTVALPFMREQKDGLLIHTASMAGRFIGGLSGPIYTVAQHGIVAVSHGLNMQECVHGIRSTGGGDADPRPAAESGGAGGAGAYGASGGLRRSDPVYRVSAEASGDERGASVTDA
jgi:NADP-dependent 3-hydroxy acid dehydrogenase YdfG